MFFDNVDELREEYDWMYEFMSRMAEQIRGDPDVHSLHDYVRKIEGENASLRELVKTAWRACPVDQRDCYSCEHSTEWGDCWLYIRMRDLGIEVDG